MRRLDENQQTIKLQVCLPVNLHYELNELSKKSMVSMGALIRQLIIKEFQSSQKDVE
jgi:hypothetical protein